MMTSTMGAVGQLLNWLRILDQDLQDEHPGESLKSSTDVTEHVETFYQKFLETCKESMVSNNHLNTSVVSELEKHGFNITLDRHNGTAKVFLKNGHFVFTTKDTA